MLKIIANYKYLLLLVGIALAAFITHSVANRMAESYQQKRRALSIPAKIAVVALDEESLARLQFSPKEPLSDQVATALIERLLTFSPKAIFADLALFSEEPNIQLQEREAGKVHYFREQIRDITDTTPIQQNGSSLPLILYKSGTGVSLVAPQGGPSSFNTFADVLNINRAASEVASSDHYINFYNSKEGLPYIPLHIVLELPQAELQEQLRDAIIFLGIKSSVYKRGEVNSWQHPVALLKTSLYGIDIHATTLANLLSYTWIRGIPSFWAGLMVLAASLLVVIIATSFSFKTALALLVAFCGLTMYATDFFLHSLFILSSALYFIVFIQILGILYIVAREFSIVPKMIARLGATFALR